MSGIPLCSAFRLYRCMRRSEITIGSRPSSRGSRSTVASSAPLGEGSLRATFGETIFGPALIPVVLIHRDKGCTARSGRQLLV